MIALLDVNVLVALAWPNHVHHESASQWFLDHRTRGWATAPLTEAGFVRVSSNRRVIPEARSPKEAIDLLGALRDQPGHHFWSDDVSLADCPEIAPELITGFRQVTDAHLLALAMRRSGCLVTFDNGLKDLGSRAVGEVELLRM
ncbi:MAG: TA system VapC family ribonuclease toxin [Candidatus Nanopelagicales bacterium]|nr:VapC toxin family PIN domain ribonuclease [Candidatus Nanopelagicales bacterium]MDZ4250736.1 TA system VapC family ribonuclease toxin [Candidatus Nanopelagicales bacterium]